jgi:hypothetical protein
MKDDKFHKPSLDKSICIRCVNRHRAYNWMPKDDERRKLPWTRIDDDMWEKENKVHCSAMNNLVDNRLVVSDCIFVLEQVIQYEERKAMGELEIDWDLPKLWSWTIENCSG